MIKNSNISKNLSGYAAGRNPAWNPLSHRLAVFIPLLLALVIGSAGQTVPAQAQIPVINFSYRVAVIDPPRQICVGETKEFKVSLREIIAPGSNQTEEPAEMQMPPGTTIAVTVENSSIAAPTGVSSILVSSPNASSYRPGIVVFTVKGKKAGHTLITFDAAMTHFFAQPAPVEVKVANCPVYVQAISRFFKKFPNGSTKFRAVTTQQAKVTADENTNSYSGEAPVFWIATSKVPHCAPSDSISLGNVHISGTADEDTGTLHLNLLYDPVNYSEVIPCSGGSGGSTGQISTTSIDVIVPRSGGVRSVHQDLTLEGISVTGSVDVYVFPSQFGTGP